MKKILTQHKMRKIAHFKFETASLQFVKTPVRKMFEMYGQIKHDTTLRGQQSPQRQDGKTNKG